MFSNDTTLALKKSICVHPHQTPPTAVCGTQTMTMRQGKIPKGRPYPTPICNVGFSY